MKKSPIEEKDTHDQVRGVGGADIEEIGSAGRLGAIAEELNSASQPGRATMQGSLV